MIRRIGLIAFLWVLPLVNLEATPGTLKCDRAMRKTIEAMQAFRRQHGGEYPDSLSQLVRLGYLQPGDASCPVAGHLNGDENAALISSRRAGGDRTGLYEYEMSTNVLLLDSGRLFLGANPPTYTRRQLKQLLLSRKFAEQVPLLRCGEHKEEVPAGWQEEGASRNATAVGTVYWSGDYWEKEWVADVPATCRDINLFFGLKGPPFYIDVAPSLDGALDLRRWSNAFGDVSWWWEYPFFEEDANRQTTPNLQAFFKGQHGQTREVGGHLWWINGLVQLQGRIFNDSPEDKYHKPNFNDFPWKRRELRVERHFRTASWLQATLWVGNPGEEVGWLVWTFEDGQSETVPIRYGTHTGRFWADDQQRQEELDNPHFATAIWLVRQTSEESVRPRDLRLYEQTWTNPRPLVRVQRLDFISNTNSPASPLLVSIRVDQ